MKPKKAIDICWKILVNNYKPNSPEQEALAEIAKILNNTYGVDSYKITKG